MKIGIVTINYPPNVFGGSHLSSYLLAKGLSKNGINVDVFTLSSRSSAQKRRAWEVENVKVHEIFGFSRHYSNPIEEKIQTNRMEKILNEYLKSNNMHFDILFAYGMDTIPAILRAKNHAKKTAAIVNCAQWGLCPYFLIDSSDSECFRCNFYKFFKCNFSRLFKKPIIGSGSNQLLKILLSPLIWIDFSIKKRKMKKLDLLLALSNKIAISVRNILNIKHELPVCQITIEPPDYSKGKKEYYKIKKELGIPNDKKLLIFPGRLIPTKGIKTILDAIKLLKNKTDEFHMLFLGDGKLSKYSKKFVKSNNLKKYISFKKFVQKDVLNHFYKNAYCTLYPSSFFEPLGRTPIESLVNGTPVIGTNRGGLNESIINNETGLVVKPDDPKDLANKILYLLDNAKLRQNFIPNCLKISKKFILKNEIKEYITVFNKILKNN